MKILVTGALGQLGREMRRVGEEMERQCPEEKWQWLFTDVAELDITDEAAVRALLLRERPDTVVNCAAYTNVDRAEEQEPLALKLNGEAPGILARACHEAGARLLHVSTDYVFSGEGCIPWRESDTPCPRSAYGRTKLRGEEEIARAGCPYLILRTAWLYSPWGKNFVKTMLRLTREREELGVVFDQVGSPTLAADLANAIGRVLPLSWEGKEGVYHFTDEGVCSWYDLALETSRLARHRCRVRPILSSAFPSKVERPHYSVLDKGKFSAAFAYTIPHWRESLERAFPQIEAEERREESERSKVERGE